MSERLMGQETDLREAVKNAFLGAVHRGDPCPFCLARTNNIWPYCVHFNGCAAKGCEPCTSEETDEPEPEPLQCPRCAEKDFRLQKMREALRARDEELGRFSNDAKKPI